MFAVFVMSGTMTVLCYYRKSHCTSLKPANILKHLQTVTKHGIHVDNLEWEVCLHIELKPDEGSNVQLVLVLGLVARTHGGDVL